MSETRPITSERERVPQTVLRDAMPAVTTIPSITPVRLCPTDLLN